MAELLSRLLSRQRRRNPFSDVMGPNPLESQAAMDEAQGADVSTPAPVSRRGPAADAGEGILMAGGGGGPIRTAGFSGGDAPVQTTVQGNAGGQTRATQTQCPGGRCGPRTVVGGSNYQIIDDGGFPITSSTVVAGPAMGAGETIVSGGAMASGAPQPSIFDVQGVVDAARYHDQVGNPSARQLEKDAVNFGFTDRQLGLNERIINSNIAREDRAALFAEREQNIAAAKTAAEIESLNQDTALAAQQTQLTREATGLGQFDTRRQIISQMISDGGSPEDAAHALARLSSPISPTYNKDGKPVAPDGATAIPQQALDEGRKQAFGAYAVHVFVTSQQTRETADLVASGQQADSVAPLPDETQDAYVQRVYSLMAERRGQSVARSADAIVGGLQNTKAWQDGNWNEVNLALENYVGAPLNQYTRKSFLDARRDDIAALPPGQREAATTDTVNRAEQYANYAYAYFRAEALGAFMRSKGGQYDNNMTYLQNAGRAAEYFGGDKKPESPKPVDSNDTLPPLKYNPIGGIKYGQ
jgi:hypothetical protein